LSPIKWGQKPLEMHPETLAVSQKPGRISLL
jgi:hypothetical protein